MLAIRDDAPAVSLVDRQNQMFDIFGKFMIELPVYVWIWPNILMQNWWASSPSQTLRFSSSFTSGVGKPWCVDHMQLLVSLQTPSCKHIILERWTLFKRAYWGGLYLPLHFPYHIPKYSMFFRASDIVMNQSMLYVQEWGIMTISSMDKVCSLVKLNSYIPYFSCLW